MRMYMFVYISVNIDGHLPADKHFFVEVTLSIRYFDGFILSSLPKRGVHTTLLQLICV